MTMDTPLHDLLGSTFDRYAVRDHVRTGDRHAVFEVTVEGRRAACKVTDEHPATLAREAAVLRAVNERTSLPVPTVLADDDGVLLLEWVDGERVDGADSNPRRLEAVGRTLARLHEATVDWFDGHGPVADSGRPLAVADPVPWRDRLATFVGDWAAALRGTRHEAVATALVEFVEEHRDTFDDCPPVLVHGEPCPEHLPFAGGGDDAVASLLDWELAQAAPGEFDLVWAERDFLRRPFEGAADPDLLGALHDGYESVRPLSSGWPVRREVYRAGFAVLSLPRDEPETDGDRGASLAQYAFERLDAAEAAVRSV